MLMAERYEKIVQLVNERGSVRVSELSAIFKVTEETIRRDLDRLEQAGRLRRSHGGAVSVKEQSPEVPYFEREVTNVQEKKAIAVEAVKRIEAGDRIILDASSTAWYMAKILPDIPLTVLTNSIKVALELAGKEKIEVISTGGILSPRSLSYTGPLAEASLVQYHVNKTFLSCKGVHLERGITESNEWQANLKRKMVKMADEVFLLVDSSKLGVQEFAYVVGMDEIDTFITDHQASQTFLKDVSEKFAIQTVQAAAQTNTHEPVV